MMGKKVKYNKSKTYLLPLISELVNIDIKFYKYLREVYIFDNENLYKDCIFLKHDFSFKNPEFTKYENNLKNNELFVDLIDDGNQVIYIFKFPEEYMKEYNLYKEGKYSKFGEDAKDLIINFFGEVYSNNLNAVKFLIKVKQVLNKSALLKKQLEGELCVKISENSELTDIMDNVDETYIIPSSKSNVIKTINEN